MAFYVYEIEKQDSNTFKIFNRKNQPLAGSGLITTADKSVRCLKKEGATCRVSVAEMLDGKYEDHIIVSDIRPHASDLTDLFALQYVSIFSCSIDNWAPIMTSYFQLEMVGNSSDKKVCICKIKRYDYVRSFP